MTSGGAGRSPLVPWQAGSARHYLIRVFKGGRWETTSCSLRSAMQSLSDPVLSLFCRLLGTSGFLACFLQYGLL